MKKKLLALGLAAGMMLSALTGCGGSTSTAQSTEGGTTETGSVYYLNSKPEQDAQ